MLNSLKINPDKYHTVHIGTSPRTCLPTEFFINETAIHYLLDFDELTFLGKPVGFQLINDHSSIKEFYEKASVLIGSVLAPWQKLDALKAFFYPALQLCSKNKPASQSRLGGACLRNSSLDQKDILYLPPRAANEYIYGSADDTLLGVPVAAEDSDLAMIDGAFKLLTSGTR